MVERREFERHRTGGDLEITSVIGGAAPSATKAKILNCSRGGALFRLSAPSRGLFKKRASAPLSERDSITCVLRLPPAYTSIEMFGEVVRVESCDVAGDYEIGLRFFHDVSRRTVMDPRMDVLGQLLEPKKLAAEASEERKRKLEENARRSGRYAKKTEELEELSCSEAARMVAKTSQRMRARTSQRLAASDPDEPEALSCSEAARMVAKTSQRLKRSDPQATQRLKKVDPQATQRLKKADPQATQRLKRASGRTDTQPTRRLKRVSGRHAVSKPSSRIGTVDLDSSARRRLDDSQLFESQIRTPTLASWAQTRLTIASEPRLLDFGGQLGVRGRAVLRDGSAVVALPDAFAARVESVASLTVHLTPRGPAALYLAQCKPDRIVVRGVQNREVNEVEFDYLVIADRGSPPRA